MGIETKYHLELRLKSAQAYEALGNNLHAMQVYYSIIKDEPDYVEAYFSLAELYEKQGSFDSAKNLLSEYIEENPSNNLVRLFFAQFLLRNSKWDNVIEILQIMDINEEPITAFFLGYSFFMLKDFEHAKINFQHFIRIGKRTELLNETYLYLAKTEIELKNFDKAIDYARKSEVIYSNYWELHLVLAVAQYNLDMLTHAVASISKCTKLIANEPVVCKWAGKIFLKTGEYLKAEEYFLKFIELEELPSSDIYSDLGETYLKTNKLKNALQYYELALKLDPLNKFAAEGRKITSSIILSGGNEN